MLGNDQEGDEAEQKHRKEVDDRKSAKEETDVKKDADVGRQKSEKEVKDDNPKESGNFKQLPTFSEAFPDLDPPVQCFIRVKGSGNKDSAAIRRDTKYSEEKQIGYAARAWARKKNAVVFDIGSVDSDIYIKKNLTPPDTGGALDAETIDQAFLTALDTFIQARILVVNLAKDDEIRKWIRLKLCPDTMSYATDYQAELATTFLKPPSKSNSNAIYLKTEPVTQQIFSYDSLGNVVYRLNTGGWITDNASYSNADLKKHTGQSKRVFQIIAEESMLMGPSALLMIYGKPLPDDYVRDIQFEQDQNGIKKTTGWHLVLPELALIMHKAAQYDPTMCLALIKKENYPAKFPSVLNTFITTITPDEQKIYANYFQEAIAFHAFEQYYPQTFRAFKRGKNFPPNFTKDIQTVYSELLTQEGQRVCCKQFQEAIVFHTLEQYDRLTFRAFQKGRNFPPNFTKDLQTVYSELLTQERQEICCKQFQTALDKAWNELPWWGKLKAKWREIFWWKKLLTGVFILAGIAAVIAGALFPPLVPITVPLIKVTISAEAAKGILIGAGAGIAALATTTHICQVWRAPNYKEKFAPLAQRRDPTPPNVTDTGAVLPSPKGITIPLFRRDTFTTPHYISPAASTLFSSVTNSESGSGSMTSIKESQSDELKSDRPQGANKP